MPQFDTTTKRAESVWKSPDGQREIFKVTLDVDGTPLPAKTYSKDISVAGWTGKVESYEKQGRNGPETFVKQPPKEGFSGGGGYSKGGFKQPADQFTMYLSYAKDIAVGMLTVDGKLDEAEFGKVLSAVSDGGKTLYENRPDAKPKEEEPKTEKKLDEVFGDTESFSLEDV